MRKLAFVFAAVYIASSLAAVPTATAHSVKQCQNEIKWFTRLCKFGISMRLMGVCDTKKSIKWCSNKKLHKEKFHK